MQAGYPAVKRPEGRIKCCLFAWCPQPEGWGWQFILKMKSSFQNYNMKIFALEKLQ